MRRSTGSVRTLLWALVALAVAMAVPLVPTPAGAAGTAEAFSLALVSGQVQIHDAAAPLDLGRPTTLSGSIDTGAGGTGAISAGVLSTPPVSFPTTAQGLPVLVRATFGQVTTGSGTGSIDAAGNVTFSTTLTVDLHLDIGDPVALTADCRATPVPITLSSDAPYDPATGLVTVRDADFSIPAVPTTDTCIALVASSVNDLLAGSGNSIVLSLQGDVTLPPAPGCPSITTVSVPAPTSYQGDATTLGATVAADPAGAGTPACAEAAGVTPSGSVEFRSGSQVVGVRPLDATGSAQLVTSSLPVGSAPITARYRGEPPYSASTSAPVAHQVLVKPAIVADVPPAVTIGASPVEIDVTASNTGLGADLVNGRLDLTIANGPGTDPIQADTFTLERFDGAAWVPVPLETALGAGIFAPIGPIGGVPLPAGAEVSQRIRLGAVAGSAVAPITLTFELIPVDPAAGTPAPQAAPSPGALARTSVSSFLVDAVRRAPSFTLGALSPHTLRQGMVAQAVVDLAAPPPAAIAPTGTYQVLLDGVPVPSRITDMDPALGYQPKVTVTAASGSAPLFVIPTDSRTGTRQVTVRYSGDALYAPAQVTGTITVLPDRGTTYTCANASLLGTNVFNVNVAAHANLPATAKAGLAVPVGQLDVSLIADRGQAVDRYGSIFGPSNPVDPEASFGMTGVALDLGELGSGTASAVTFTNNVPMLDDTRPVDPDPDQVIGLEGATATVTLAGVPGTEVPVTLDRIAIDAFVGVSYPLECTPLDEPASLGTVTVAGTTLAVDAPSPTRLGDSVTLRATVAPAGAPGTVELRDGTTTLAVVPVAADGTASFATSALALGDHTFTATFRGGSASVSSTSAPVSLTVVDRYECPAAAQPGSSAVVRLIYLTLLHRCPDAGGLAHWVGRLDAGTSPAVVARSISGGTEAQGVLVDLAFHQVLDRGPDPAGRAYWVRQLRRGYRYDRLLTSLASSSEFHTAAGGTATGFVTRLYDRFLHRSPDAAGLAFWTRRLATGSRTSVARAFVARPEPQGERVSAAYATILDREPTAAELAAARKALAADGDLAALYGRLIATPEFATRAQTLPNP